MLEIGAVLNYDLPQLLNWILHIFECFLSVSPSMESGGSQKKRQKVLDKYDNIRKEKPAKNYTRITY